MTIAGRIATRTCRTCAVALAASVLITGFLAPNARADDVADFYKGKDVK
jgi:hypothetical protein